MKRLARRLSYVLAVVLVLGVVALVGLRFYLGSDRGRNLLVEQLTATLGGTVEIDQFEVSTFGTSRVRGLRVFDAETGKTFLDADDVGVDLSALGLLVGRRMPHRVDVSGAHIRLRFDAAGKLLTQLPSAGAGGPMPRVHLVGGRLALEQNGRPTLVLDHLSLQITARNKDNLTGTLDDPTFGHFDITGHAGDALTLALKGNVPRITPAMLRALPFVPPAVWQQIEAEGVEVPLDLGFTFQKSAPEVRYRVGFAKARVRLLQSDRPPLEVYPAQGTLEGNNAEFALNGDIRDPYWGDWAVHITDKESDRELRITLKTASVRVDQKKLEALPYVPKHVWQEVRAEGQTAVEVVVRLPADRPGVNYRVDLDVSRANVEVTSIALKASDATGKVRIEDSLVHLEKVTGKAANGQIATTGDLDFRTPPSTLKFAVAIQNVGLRDLPEKWGLRNKKIDGKVSGKANLILTLHEKGLETRGSGEGQIDDAKLLGFKTARPIKLTLHADGKRFLFKPHSPMLSSVLSTMLVLIPSEVSMPVIARVAPPPVRLPITPNAIADLAGRALAGMEMVSRKVAQGTHETLRLVSKLEKPFRAKETSYLDVNIQLDDIDVAELAKRLDLTLPFEFVGRLSIQMLLGVPINNAHDLRDYRFTGSATSSRLAIAGLEMRNSKAHVDYARGILRLTELSGQVPFGKEAGTFSGSARMGVVPRGELSFEGKLDRIPGEAIAKFIPGAQGRLAGLLGGQLSARVAVDHLDNPAAWKGSARLASPDLRAFGLSFRNLSADANLADGKATLRDLGGELYKGKLTGSATLDLAGKGSYKATFAVRGADLAGPGALLPAGFAPGGTGDLFGVVRGTTSPLTLAGSGSIRTRGVRVGKIHIDDLASDWTLDGDLFRLSKITGKLYKGAATGSVEVRLLSTAGKVKIRLVDLDSAVLGKAVEGLPIKLEGLVTADAEVSFAPTGGRTRVTSQIDLTSANLRLQGILTRKVHGKLDWKGETLNYRLEGETLGGKFSVDGIYPPPPKAPAGQSHGYLRLDRVSIRRLVRARHLEESWRPLTGFVSLSLPFRLDGAEKVVGEKGRFEIVDLRWDDSELSDLLRGDIHVEGGSLTVRHVTGTLAGGLLRIAGGYRFTGTRRGWFNVTLMSAEARKLLMVVGMKDRIAGPIDVTLRGEISDEWRGSGSVLLRRGRVDGVQISDWRMPLEFTFDPETGQTELVVSDSSAQVGQGRARLHGNLHLGDAVRAEGNLVLFDASLGALAGLIGDVSSHVNGRVSGRVDFGGSNMRSLDDLTVKVRAKLRDAQALKLPILRVLAPYLPRQHALEFTRGTLSAQLRGGVFRIDDLTLESDIVQLVLFGTITTAGRLDLDVTAHAVNRSVNNFAAGRLARGLPAIGSVPVTVLLSATNLLANQLLHFRISGTTRSPSVTLQPIRLLSEGAVRLFLTPFRATR